MFRRRGEIHYCSTPASTNAIADHKPHKRLTLILTPEVNCIEIGCWKFNEPAAYQMSHLSVIVDCGKSCFVEHFISNFSVAIGAIMCTGAPGMNSERNKTVCLRILARTFSVETTFRHTEFTSIEWHLN